jgi:hypothetical protein
VPALTPSAPLPPAPAAEQQAAKGDADEKPSRAPVEATKSETPPPPAPAAAKGPPPPPPAAAAKQTAEGGVEEKAAEAAKSEPPPPPAPAAAKGPPPPPPAVTKKAAGEEAPPTTGQAKSGVTADIEIRVRAYQLTHWLHALGRLR